MGGNINGVKVSVLMYADDLVLLSQTENRLQCETSIRYISSVQRIT